MVLDLLTDNCKSTAITNRHWDFTYSSGLNFEINIIQLISIGYLHTKYIF